MQRNEEEIDQCDVFQEYPIEAREALLRANCTASSEREIEKAYSQEELDTFKHELVEGSMALAALKEELKRIQDEYKLKMKPIESLITQNIRNLRSKQYTTMEVVYEMSNFESGKMEFFDKNGIFLNSRKLLPSEKQFRTIELGKQA